MVSPSTTRVTWACSPPWGVALAVGDGEAVGVGVGSAVVAVGDGEAAGDGDVTAGDGDTCSEATVGDAATASRGVGLAVAATRVAVWAALPSSLVSAQAQTARATISNKPRPK